MRLLRSSPARSRRSPRPREHGTYPRDLSTRHAVGSTGFPLSPEAFRWIYDKLGDDTRLFSTSGDTDVCTAFVVGVPTLPVYQGLQAASLGCKIEAWNENGEPLIDAVGELVITERHNAIPYGRSDSTINRAGVRIGTSEIYRAVLADPDVVDALVVDVPRHGAESWMPLLRRVG